MAQFQVILKSKKQIMVECESHNVEHDNKYKKDIVVFLDKNGNKIDPHPLVFIESVEAINRFDPASGSRII